MREELILILDFGSQVTQLIARRLREAGVYSEILPAHQADAARIRKSSARGIILSGGPASVSDAEAPGFRQDSLILACPFSASAMASS